MTLELKNIKGTKEEMKNLFEKANIRLFQTSYNFNNVLFKWDIIIRCEENMATKLKKKRTIKGIMKEII